MSLGFRKMMVVVLVGAIFLLANVVAVAGWLAERGVAEKAAWLRQEFLTGTAIAVIVALLILLVGPSSSKAGLWAKRCPVCGKRLLSSGDYCSACGSRVT